MYVTPRKTGLSAAGMSAFSLLIVGFHLLSLLPVLNSVKIYWLMLISIFHLAVHWSAAVLFFSWIFSLLNFRDDT